MLVQPVNSFHPKHTQRHKCSQNIASFNVLMMLTALMTVSIIKTLRLAMF